MSMFCCDRNNTCVALSVVASLVIGIVTAFLQLTAAITVTPAFLWVVLGVAIVYPAVLLLAVALSRGTCAARCLCPILTALLAGIVGSALLSVVLLAITFPATSVFGAIVVGALLLFFSLIVTATACLVRCLAACYD